MTILNVKMLFKGSHASFSV